MGAHQVSRYGGWMGQLIVTFKSLIVNYDLGHVNSYLPRGATGIQYWWFPLVPRNLNPLLSLTYEE